MLDLVSGRICVAGHFVSEVDVSNGAVEEGQREEWNNEGGDKQHDRVDLAVQLVGPNLATIEQLLVPEIERCGSIHHQGGNAHGDACGRTTSAVQKCCH